MSSKLNPRIVTSVSNSKPLKRLGASESVYTKGQSLQKFLSNLKGDEHYSLGTQMTEFPMAVAGCRLILSVDCRYDQFVTLGQ